MKKKKKAKFYCEKCGKAFCCPTCKRPYDDAQSVARKIIQEKRIHEEEGCDECKTNFSSAVGAALKKLDLNGY